MASPAITTGSGSTSVDWSTFYSGLQKDGNIPNASSAQIDALNAVFRQMYLDLGDLKQQIAASGFSPTHVTIYADVLNIPAGLSWPLASSALTIYARQIVSDPSAVVILDYRTSPSAILLVFSNGIQGSLTAQAVVGSVSKQPVTFTLNTTTLQPGIAIQNVNGTPVQSTLTRNQGVPGTLPQDFVLGMNNAFIFGSLLYDSNPTLALNIFTWVKDWSAPSADLLGLFLRSSSLVALLSAQISAAANGATFVPYLTSAIYTNLSSAFVAQAQQYESDYMNLSTQQVVTQQGIQFAQALLNNAISQSNYVAGLLAQASTNYTNATAAVMSALANFRTQQIAVNNVAADFQQIGLPEYERAQIAAAIFSMATAIVTFGGAIAAMAVGDGAAAPAAASGAIEAVKAVESATTLAKQLADAMSKLKKVMEALKKVYDLSAAVVAASKSISSAGSFVDQMQAYNPASGVDSLSSSDQWDIFVLQANNVLQTPVDKGIGYAADYKEALDILAIYGKSLSSAQTAAVQAAQQYAAVQLQQQLALQQQANLAQLVNSLTVGSQPIALMMQQFYQRYLDAKSSLFASIQNYRASYYYWALTPSSVQPRIIDTVNTLETGLSSLTAIALDQANALNRFDPPPQTIANKQFPVTDPTAIAALRKGQATVIIPSNAGPFTSLNRVRLDTIRVWLDGAKLPYGKTISVRISSSGNYSDRFSGASFTFNSKPLTRLFEYHVLAAQTHAPQPAWVFANGDEGFIELDGSVDNEVQYAYFQPTPFSQWTISVNPAENPGLDLSGLTSFTFQFQGSAIA